MHWLVLVLCLALPLPVANAGGTFEPELVLESPSGAVCCGGFGQAVAVAGADLLIGAPGDEAYTGAAFLFHGTTGALIRSFPNPSPERPGAGASVAATGHTIIVGHSSGVIHLFDRAGGQLLRTIAQPTTDFGGFGGSVAGIAGDVLAGAPDDLGHTGFGRGGAAYLFDGSSGAVLHVLDNPSPGVGDAFGAAVAAADGVLLVAAPSDDTGGVDAGALYAFDAGRGILLRTFDNPEPAVTRHFGAALSAAGGKVLVGGPDRDHRIRGAAFLFDAQTGDLLHRFTNPADGIGDFAYSTALFGSRVAVGAFDRIFVFDADTGTLLDTLTYPLPPPEHAYAVFGSALAGVGDTLLVGARNADAGRAFLYAGTCGDGKVNGGERCDDGDRSCGDGCSPECRLESCGDAAVDPGEDCDDGNAVDGDGCDANCTSTGCGNGVVTAGEACDDGNATSGDGCDENCTHGTCGNGIVAERETCDDGNAVGGDGCSAWCSVESCGNNLLDAGESCEDGALVGCDARCRLEQVAATAFTKVAGLASVAHGLCIDCDRSGALAGVGSRVAAGVGGEPRGSVQVFDVETGDLLHILEPPAPYGGPSFGRALAAAGDKLLVGEPDGVAAFAMSGVAHLFDPETGAYLRTLESHLPNDAGFGASMVASGEDNILVAGLVESALPFFDEERFLGFYLRMPPRAPYSPYALALLGPDVVVGGTGVVHLLEGGTGTLRHALGDGTDPRFGRSLAVLDGDVLIGGSDAVRRFDGTTGELVQTYAGYESVLAAANGTILVTGPPCAPFTGAAAYLLEASTGGTLGTFCDGSDAIDPFVTGAIVGDTLVLGQARNYHASFSTYAPCTDGVLVPGEECDDGNRADGDGCDRNCSVTRCGNALLTVGEACDDGNRVSGDGCEADCSLPASATTTSTTLELPAITTTTVPEACEQRGVSIIEALDCVLARGSLAVPECAEASLPNRVTRRLEQARSALERARASVGSKRAVRILATAVRTLRQAGRLAKRAGRHGRLSPECAAALQRLVATARVVE